MCPASLRSDPSFIPNVSLDPEPYLKLRALFPDDALSPTDDNPGLDLRPLRREWEGEGPEAKESKFPGRLLLASGERAGPSEELREGDGGEDSEDTESVMSDKCEQFGIYWGFRKFGYSF